MGWGDPIEGTTTQQIVRAALVLEAAIRRRENDRATRNEEALIKAREQLTALFNKVS
jgi:hypothetical protein